MIDRIIVPLLYRIRRYRSSNEQKKYLPSTYREYERYRDSYSIAPGDVILMEDNVSLVKSIEGEPTMNAKVVYIDLERDEEYTTGLVNVIRQQ